MRYPLSNLVGIPSPDILKRRLQALAMLDAVLMPEWEMRYFSFNSKWSPDEMMGSMRDGQGSEFFFLFSQAGTIGKIFSKDDGSFADTAGLKSKIPAAFASFAQEAAFSLDGITCLLWQELSDTRWTIQPSFQNLIPFEDFLADDGEYYRQWAEKYYERPVSASAVQMVFGHQALTKDLVSLLNVDADFETVMEDASEIGYPIC